MEDYIETVSYTHLHSFSTGVVEGEVVDSWGLFSSGIVGVGDTFLEASTGVWGCCDSIVAVSYTHLANLNGITQRVSSTESTISTHTTQIGTVDGKINTAKTDAINTAATDATNKANKAKTDAISTASADATTKANNALKDGKSYTDIGLKPVKDTLATHTTEISTTKQQVSTIETNLG